MIVAAFGLAGLGETWRLAGSGPAEVAADLLLVLAVAVVLATTLFSARTLTAGHLHLEPRWCLSALVLLAGAHRFADLDPALGRPLVLATALLAAAVSGAAILGWTLGPGPTRPEHLLPTTTTAYSLTLAFAGSRTELAYAAFAAGTVGWLVVAGSLARRDRRWPNPSVVTLSTPSLAGLAWLDLHDGRVDAVAVVIALVATATAFGVRPATGGTPWTALFPATAAARLLTALTSAGSAPVVALVLAAGLTVAVLVRAGLAASGHRLGRGPGRRLGRHQVTADGRA